MENDKMYNLSKFVKESKVIQEWNLYTLLAKYESLIKTKKIHLLRLFILSVD